MEARGQARQRSAPIRLDRRRSSPHVHGVGQGAHVHGMRQIFYLTTHARGVSDPDLMLGDPGEAKKEDAV